MLTATTFIFLNFVPYTHLTLFTGPHFTDSQIFEVAPQIKVPNLDPAIDRSNRIVQPLRQVFEPYCIVFKELKEKKKQLPITMFLQRY